MGHTIGTLIIDGLIILAIIFLLMGFVLPLFDGVFDGIFEVFDSDIVDVLFKFLLILGLFLAVGLLLAMVLAFAPKR